MECFRWKQNSKHNCENHDFSFLSSGWREFFHRRKPVDFFWLNGRNRLIVIWRTPPVHGTATPIRHFQKLVRRPGFRSLPPSHFHVQRSFYLELCTQPLSVSAIGRDVSLSHHGKFILSGQRTLHVWARLFKRPAPWKPETAPLLSFLFPKNPRIQLVEMRMVNTER